MLEEKLGVEMENVFADVEENELCGFDDVGADRPERQPLDVGVVDLRQAAIGRLERDHVVCRICRLERR